MWSIRILPAAVRELEGLDKSVGGHIVRRIRWLAENLDTIRAKALKGSLAVLFTLREGDYRIIYQVLRKENNILIHSIGHRKDIYRAK